MPLIGRQVGRPTIAGFTAPGRPQAVTTGQRAVDVTVPVGWAALRAVDDPALAVVCELGDRIPTPTQGYGGVDEVDRVGLTALTRWRGFKAFGIDIDLVLDGTENDRTVKPAMDVLEALAGRGPRATGGEPPHVIVDTAGVMPHDVIHSPTLRWWVNDLDWSDDEEDAETNDAGERVLALVTVSLLQVVTDTRFNDLALAARQKIQGRKKAKRTYTVKQGETLVTIARDKLGDAGRWQEIADMNGIRDPRSVRHGAEIRLP